MSEDERDVDKLLQSHVQNVLSQFDWDELGNGITRRLDTCDRRPRLARPWAIAAAVVLAAGVLIVAVAGLKHVVWRHQATTGWAKVPLSDSPAGKATVTLLGTAPQARGTCELIPSARRVPDESKPSRPSLCVVVGQESSGEGNSREDDLEAIMHLL
jgi:hypothetical protein